MVFGSWSSELSVSFFPFFPFVPSFAGAPLPTFPTPAGAFCFFCGFGVAKGRASCSCGVKVTIDARPVFGKRLQLVRVSERPFIGRRAGVEDDGAVRIQDFLEGQKIAGRGEARGCSQGVVEHLRAERIGPERGIGRIDVAGLESQLEEPDEPGHRRGSEHQDHEKKGPAFHWRKGSDLSDQSDHSDLPSIGGSFGDSPRRRSGYPG